MIGLAIALAVVGSLAFASGATAQHRGVDANVAPGGDRRLTLSRTLSLLRTPIWLVGLLLVGLGASLHIAALKLAPLSVIQPVGILAVPFSVLLAAKLKGRRPSPIIWLAVAITVAGIVSFTWFSTRHAALQPVLDETPTLWGAMALAWVFAGACAALGLKGPPWLRSLAWASGGAALYGLGSGFIKMLTEILPGPDPLGHIVFWHAVIGLATAYSIGGWMIQQAYASGPAEVVVGSMTTVDPLVSVLFGLIVLGEGANLPIWAGIGMTLAGAVACAGVVLLSRHHPDALRAYETSEVNR